MSDIAICDMCGCVPTIFDYFPNLDFPGLQSAVVCNGCSTGEVMTMAAAERIVARRNAKPSLVIGVDPGTKEAGSVVYGIGHRVIGHTKPPANVRAVAKTTGTVEVDPIVFKVDCLEQATADRIGREVRAELEKLWGSAVTIPKGYDLEFIAPKGSNVFDEVTREANRALSAAILGHAKCRRCSGGASRDGYCEYCFGSSSYSGPAERDAVIAKCADAEDRNVAARVRNEAALAADRPRPTKSSREAEKPHPWEAWSTSGDES
jgi:hypothetical protein